MPDNAQYKIRNIVHQPVIDSNEIESAIQLGLEDLVRLRENSPPFEFEGHNSLESLLTSPNIAPSIVTPSSTKAALNNTSAPLNSTSVTTQKHQSPLETPHRKGRKSIWRDFKPEQSQKRGNIMRKNVAADGNCFFR